MNYAVVDGDIGSPCHETLREVVLKRLVERGAGHLDVALDER
jgi:hypothetical protein